MSEFDAAGQDWHALMICKMYFYFVQSRYHGIIVKLVKDQNYYQKSFKSIDRIQQLR